jgi:hypothetical protein
MHTRSQFISLGQLSTQGKAGKLQYAPNHNSWYQISTKTSVHISYNFSQETQNLFPSPDTLDTRCNEAYKSIPRMLKTLFYEGDTR